MNKLVTTLAAILLASTAAFAQKDLLEKPFDQWSQKDAMEILNNSAWARTHVSNSSAAAASQADALRHQADNSLSGAERSRSDRSGALAPVIARLYSGLPIRMAIARLNQIGVNYDKMDDKAKAQFNEQGKKLLDCAQCQNFYIVQVTQPANSTGQFVEDPIFQGMTLAELKSIVTLKNDKGETRELAHFIAPAKRGDVATFAFARKDAQGNLLVNKDSKELYVAFANTFLSSSHRFAPMLPRQFEFKISKITFKDTVVF